MTTPTDPARIAAPSDAVESIEDPVLTAVLANRFDGIVREMSNTLLRAARSTVIAAAKDFSCAILTAGAASAARLPVTADLAVPK